jgi:ectoine hydroxylase-related dioxygenase (phytanoyl-CoA dioxygenase family)
MSLINNEFKKQGYYHGKNKFAPDVIHQFKNEFDVFFKEKRDRFKNRFTNKSDYSANHDINRWNMLIPSNSFMLSSSFYATDEIFNTLKEIFDGDFSLVFFSSDISSPGSAFQTIHQDGNDFSIALNVPLIDSNEINGATHVFPYTHLEDGQKFSCNSNNFSDTEIIERVKNLSPLSLNVNVGDYTLRDLRLIHRGTPNKTNEHRPYLSSIFMPSEKDSAPEFKVIEYGLSVFQDFKNRAFPKGRADLIDFANTFGRVVISLSFSDRIKYPVPISISNQLNQNALYCLRFSKFEDEKLNSRINRNKSSSEYLLSEIEKAKVDFEKLIG